ncbi:hypothetical protein CDAR_571271 [Caerostris darwini]|uniref:Uncharacterized protein n=1 Tax=Caerostris darwini TaxID=1538125 RepID=A0AAV4SJG8_9ARAC|nr:hypothetical protein CDAR_571271 [Caerostris darwini]
MRFISSERGGTLFTTSEERKRRDLYRLLAEKGGPNVTEHLPPGTEKSIANNYSFSTTALREGKFMCVVMARSQVTWCILKKHRSSILSPHDRQQCGRSAFRFKPDMMGTMQSIIFQMFGKTVE